MDYGHRVTEELLRALEAEISAEYTAAGKEVAEAADEFFREFEIEDAKYAEAVDKGEMSEKAYQRWRRSKLARGEGYRQMREDIAARIRDAARIAAAYVDDTLPAVFALNRTYAAYAIERAGANLGVGTSFSIYSEDVVKRLIVEHPELLPNYPRRLALDVPKEMRWLREKISSQVLHGILGGETIPKIASRMVDVVGMDKNVAIRNARTAVTSAENGGRMDTYDAAEAMGIRLQKEWMATHDTRTRESHGRIDGERVDKDAAFSNGCRFPGDPNGAPEEVYNCRCTMVSYLPDYPDARDRVTYQQWLERTKSKKGGKR
nr:MAG TPA: minor capsid protein [Caudoviricetes sp.]